MNIGEAIIELKARNRICREGWNGKGMFLYLMIGYGNPDYVMMKTAQDTHIPWTCSQSDLLAEDWTVVTE